jgi:ParB family chromosome partitioning protein
LSNRTQAPAPQIRPQQLDMALIDEDPRQPRTQDNPGFSDASIAELAASIRRRGVKTPISVRENPLIPGRFIINHGARRYRGSRLAGSATIPGYIDNDYSEVDQVVENLHRNALTPREVANFIGRELAKGFKKGEIAQAISKSPAFVTQHANLLDLPDVIADAFASGRAKDVTVVNELLIAYKKHSEQVSRWLRDDAQEITRSAVKRLREFLNETKRQGEAEDRSSLLDDVVDAPEHEEPHHYSESAEVASSRVRRPVLEILHSNRRGRLQLHRRPTSTGKAWIKYDDSNLEIEIELADVQLVALSDNL